MLEISHNVDIPTWKSRFFEHNSIRFVCFPMLEKRHNVDIPRWISISFELAMSENRVKQGWVVCR
jgi:hypothetical protein